MATREEVLYNLPIPGFSPSASGLVVENIIISSGAVVQSLVASGPVTIYETLQVSSGATVGSLAVSGSVTATSGVVAQSLAVSGPITQLDSVSGMSGLGVPAVTTIFGLTAAQAAPTAAGAISWGAYTPSFQAMFKCTVTLLAAGAASGVTNYMGYTDPLLGAQLAYYDGLGPTGANLSSGQAITASYVGVCASGQLMENHASVPTAASGLVRLTAVFEILAQAAI